MKPLLILALAAGALAIHSLMPSLSPPVAPRTPVLVELFTSEGCSSCPPADAELARLVRDQPVAGAEVIPLSLHVDYWNNLGWKDPYSSAQFSRRQGEYAEAFRLDSVYTPQMVVDGKTEFVGSDGERAEAVIRSAAAGQTVPVTVSLTGTFAKVEVPSLPKVRAEVMVAITEDGLISNVRAGENSGRRLSHVAVVRSLRPLGEVGGAKAFSKSVDLALSPAWKASGLSVVAFVQEAGSRRVLGAGQARLAAR